jgi:hypothetical protein
MMDCRFICVVSFVSDSNGDVLYASVCGDDQRPSKGQIPLTCLNYYDDRSHA